MTKLGEELIKGAKEALAIAEGRMEPPVIYIPETVDVAAIRKKLRLSQTAFAARFGLPIGTVRDWEQARRTPDRAASVLLAVIAHDPDAVTRAIQSRV
ncbi:DNA-binding protein [Alphaproteobacteria bacterium]|nr:DNA-binding protein [Alphaproteobacteria bacterium]